MSGEVQPGLGMSWSHVPRTRILLERVEGAVPASCTGLRSATLIKSSRQVPTSILTHELSADPDHLQMFEPAMANVESVLVCKPFMLAGSSY